MNFSSSKQKKRLMALEITPLVDVVFLLLIFFLLTATYVKNPSLDVSLPKASSEMAKKTTDDLIIDINAEGDIRYENKIITMEKLNTILNSQFNLSKGKSVVVRADKKAKHGRVVQIMDAAKKAGFLRLAIAVENE